ncbi:cytochrome b/b6 domain-containing protein [Pedobacter changchengzhani]|uniref:Cytochrome b/b6 domain-containing protein n=1 Tax=Pedobacter changchengzhani TaxID=2529274 RepID=A0A4R5MHE1_9SPHI|nr:cytochrome b/b6 domain-containing protein [Pedobacter changchengzhani]TDG34932.1 cytochrome b/b6 domain-containing protein [Pedobacter changchengzhani]
MKKEELVVENPPQPTTEKKYSRALRIWHWVNTMLICGSLITVLINSTLLDRDNSSIVQTELQQAGTTVSPVQAASVLHGMEDQVWDFHIYFGYAIATLLVFRLITEIYASPKRRLFKKVKFSYNDYFILKKNREIARHDFFVKSLYLIFYALITVMAITGLLLAFKHSIGIPESISHSIKEVHGFCMYLILGFIVLHLAGVLLSERKEGKGIVSDMINGGKEVANDNEQL